jgi:E3 ubiquitin-protein ligase RNF213
LKVHGGTTAGHIRRSVRRAQAQAMRNWSDHQVNTCLFFDEANTTRSISLIKEIMCDGTMDGEPLNLEQFHLNIIAALNPYRK